VEGPPTLVVAGSTNGRVAVSSYPFSVASAEGEHPVPSSGIIYLNGSSVWGSIDFFEVNYTVTL